MSRLLAALALLAAACTGPGGTDGTDGTSADTTLIRTDAEAPGANCERGGTRLSIGVDSNRDAVLGDAEISEVRYVCNGDGVAALHSITDGAPSCPAGGHTIHWGLDTDGDGTLGEQEQMGSFAVCDGAAGAAGSIQTLEPIEPGDTCAAGGFRISYGRDTNGNGVLDPQEIEGTSALCNGVDRLVSLIEQVDLKAGSEHCPNGGVLIRSGLDGDGSGTLEPDEIERESALCQPCPHRGSSNCTSGTLVVSDYVDLPFQPAHLAVGDLDGDGYQDIVINDTSAREVHFWRGRGDGTFDPPTLAAADASRAGPMVLADFDGDGHLDLVGGHLHGAVFALGNGDGTFGTPVEIELGGRAARGIEVISTGDDVPPGLLVSMDGAVTLLDGVGDGTFLPAQTFPADPSLLSFFASAGDLDGDGDVDLVFTLHVPNYDALAVGILLNQGDGTFSDVIPIELTDEERFRTAVLMRLADVDGDGHLDLVIFSESLVTSLPALHLALGDGQGGFSHVHSREAPPHGALELADFNGDGFLDVVAVGSGPYTIIYPTNGASIGEGLLQTNAGTIDLVLGDFNDDGKVDVVVSDQNGRRLTALLGD